MKTIRQLREERGWSQGELAWRIGVEQGTVSTWEHGRRPHLRYLLRLAHLFGVSVKELVAAQAEQALHYAPPSPQDGSGQAHVAEYS